MLRPKTANRVNPYSKVSVASSAPDFKKFLGGLKDYSGFSDVTVKKANAFVSNVNTGIKSVDDAIKGLSITKSKEGFLLMGGVPVGRINKLLREGDLPRIIKLSKLKISVTSADTAAFKRLIADTPEKAFKEVADLAATNKRVRSYLHTNVENMDKLSKKGKADVKKIENTLLKYFKTGTTIAVTLGVVYVTVDWLSKATEERKGCFMLTTINNKTTSCKVQSYSCIGNGGSMCPNALPYFNITLLLMKIATLHDLDKRKIDVATAAGLEVAELNSKLSTVIDTSYEAVSKVILSMKDRPVALDICNIRHPDIENGVVPPCRMCEPSDNPTSTTFMDASQYPDNVTFQCSINPSILDTVADVAKTTGIDLFSGVNNFVSGALKPIVITLSVILVMILLFTVVFKITHLRAKEELTKLSYRNVYI